MKPLLLPLACLLLACNHSANTKPAQADTIRPDGTQLKDTAVVAGSLPPDTITQPLPPVAGGIYQVSLPGTEHTVAFYASKAFRVQEKKRSGQPGLTLTEGTWSVSNGNISLYKENVMVGRYRLQGDTLLLLQGNKEHRLQKLTSAYDNEHWRKKKLAGVEFFGLGNEPFWNVEIDEEKAIAFHLADWGSPVAFKPSRPVVAGDSTVYQTANDSARLRIVIYKTFCSDGMSDFTYDHTVHVQYNNRLYQGCALRFK